MSLPVSDNRLRDPHLGSKVGTCSVYLGYHEQEGCPGRLSRTATDWSRTCEDVYQVRSIIGCGTIPAMKLDHFDVPIVPKNIGTSSNSIVLIDALLHYCKLPRISWDAHTWVPSPTLPRASWDVPCRMSTRSSHHGTKSHVNRCKLFPSCRWGRGRGLLPGDTHGGVQPASHRRHPRHHCWQQSSGCPDRCQDVP